jgi:RNA polymerase sigma factor (sigma-70 family)
MLSEDLIRCLRAGYAAPDEEVSDTELLRRCAAKKDDVAFELLVRRHAELVWQVCTATAGNHHAAEDAFQATFLALALRATSIRETVSGWLYRVAYNAARKLYMREKASGLPLDPVPGRSVSISPDDTASKAELAGILHDELNRLNEAYRLPLQLCYLEGHSHTEVAKILGWPVGTVATRITRGRERLRDRLIRRGVALSATGIAAVLSQGSTSALPPILVAVTALSIRSGELPNTITDLTAGVLNAMTHPKKLISFIAALAVVAIGAAITWGEMGDPLSPLPVIPPVAPEEPAPAKPTPPSAQHDRNGDPLPFGAISRLGTVRQRAPGAQVAVTADGKQIVTVDKNLVVRRFDAKTGALLSTCTLQATPADQILLSATGKRLASLHWVLGGAIEECKSTIVIWDLDRAEVMRSLAIGGLPSDQGIAFSPDEQKVGLILGSRPSNGELVQIWDPLTGKLRTLYQRTEEIRERFAFSAIRFSPDGKSVAAWIQDRWLRCWDLATDKRIWEASSGCSSIFFFSPDSRWVVTEDCKRLDATTGKPMPWPHQLPRGNELEVPLGISPDGRLLAIRTRESGVLFWDHASGKIVHEIAQPGRKPGSPWMTINELPHNFAFTPDSTGYVWRSGPLQRWDLRTGKPVFPDTWSHGHSEAIDRVAFSPDGRRLASLATKDESRVRVWDVSMAKTLHEFSTGMSPHLAFGPGGHVFALADGLEKLALIERDAETGRNIRGYNLPDKHSFSRSNEPGKIHVDSRGETVTVLTNPLGDECVLTGWNIRTGKLLRHEYVDWDSESALTSDGTGVVAIERSLKVKLLATDSGKSRIEFQFKAPWPGGANDFQTPVQILPKVVDKRYLEKRNFAVSPDDRFAAVSVNLIDHQSRKVDATDIFVGDMATGQQLARLPRKGDVELEFSPDSRLLVSADGDGIHLWETATWKLAGTISLPTMKADVLRPWATALSISPDLRQIATGHPDGTILMWDSSLGHFRKPVVMDQAVRLWDDLASDEATRSYAAAWQLVGTPSIAIQLIQDRLKPVEPIADDELQRLVAKLGDNDFIARETAHRQLQSYGERATAAIREALKLEVTAEQRRRLELLLNTPRSVPLRSGATLHGVRAVGVLEWIGTPEARPLLETIAGGAAEARLTREAKTALARLATR